MWTFNLDLHFIYGNRIQTKKAKAIAIARIPHPLEERGRPKDSEKANAEGTKAPERITMLPKSKRLTSPLVTKVFEHGRSVFGQVISLVYAASEVASQSKFAFSVSKKVGSTAPKRNTMRRKGYAALRKLEGSIAPGYEAVFVIKKDMSKESSDEFALGIDALLKKSPLYKN